MIVLINSIYSEETGSNKYEMELKEPIKLARVLEQLESVFPGLRGHSKGGVEERYASHYLCIGSGRILRLADTIADQDTIEIIPPIMGG
jgi:molybdopterin converting factor small subunit